MPAGFTRTTSGDTGHNWHNCGCAANTLQPTCIYRPGVCGQARAVSFFSTPVFVRYSPYPCMLRRHGRRSQSGRTVPIFASVRAAPNAIFKCTKECLIYDKDPSRLNRNFRNNDQITDGRCKGSILVSTGERRWMASRCAAILPSPPGYSRHFARMCRAPPIAGDAARVYWGRIPL
jgi:hypothetical protein